ncbi:D-threo-3-hydroxyaspartate dehydratase [compost metagenome]
MIGHQPEKGWIITDSGWMAMSRDRGTQSQQCDFGYGLICDAGGKLIDGLQLRSANQEHGVASFEEGQKVNIEQQFPIGTRLRILPNHACATGAQFPDYHACDAEGLVHTWSRLHGW